MGWAEEPRGPGPNLPGKVSLGRVGRVGEGGFPISAAYSDSGVYCCCCCCLVPCPCPGSQEALLALWNPLPSVSHTKASLEGHSLAGKARSPLLQALVDTEEEGSFPQSSRASLTLEVDAFQRLGAVNGGPSGSAWQSTGSSGTRGYCISEELGDRVTSSLLATGTPSSGVL